MTQQEAINAIKQIQNFQTETTTLEAKTAGTGFPKKCYDTISSFSNKYGGIIIFGLNEEKKFKEESVYDINDLQKQIASLCSDSMDPIVRPEFLAVDYNGQKLLAVKINELPENKKPCYYKKLGLLKGSFTRVGDRDEVMTAYELYSLQSYKEGMQEDLRPIKRASLDDLNQEKIDNYLQKIREEKPNFAKSTNEKILKLSGIIDNSGEKIYPTLAGMLLFGEYPQAYLPQLFIACCVIPGTQLGDIGELGQRFDDNKRVEGTIEEMLQGTLSFLRKNMKNKVVINKKTGLREDILEYPMDALREAIANALIHRDYSLETEGAYIQVYMYTDRIEIQSPGSLYGMNKIEKLGTATIMEARNKTIIRILEENHSFIENRHSGIPTMKREMKRANLPEPEFIEEREAFKVIFRNNMPKDNKNTEAISQSITPPVTPSVTPPVNIEQSIIQYCQEAKTAKEIAQHFGYSDLKYFRNKYLKPLICKKTLRYTNPKYPNASNQKYISN